MISIIAAVAKNGVIGKNNLLPWHIPEEMKLFRALTEGKPVIIGRRTFEGLPNMLEGRFVIVLSRNQKFATGSDAIRVARSIPEALKIARDLPPPPPPSAGTPPRAGGEYEVMIAGGENVYQQFLPLADRLYISHLNNTYDGDAFFPRVSYSEWKPQTNTQYDQFSFVTYERIHARENTPAPKS